MARDRCANERGCAGAKRRLSLSKDQRDEELGSSERLRLDHFAQLSRQRVGRNWLLQERDVRLKNAVPEDRVIGVAGHVQDLHLGPHRLEPLGELSANVDDSAWMARASCGGRAGLY